MAHNLRVNAIYHFPQPAGDGLLRAAFGGWWISSIFAAQTSLPFTPQVSFNNSRSDVNNSAGAERPSYVTAQNLATARILDPAAVIYNRSTVIQHTTSQYFNPHMFTLAPAGTPGNVGRNSERGPSFVNVDFSLVKDTRLNWRGEAGSLQFRTEVFNVANHPNYGESSPTAISAIGVGLAPV